MSAEFQIAETDAFRKTIQKNQYSLLYQKIYDYVYPQLRLNPYFGPNIKKLKGQLSSYYRYRISNYRLFYAIDTNNVVVIVVSLKNRKDAY